MLHEFIIKPLSNTNIYLDKLEIVRSENKIEKTQFFSNYIYIFRENGPLQGLIAFINFYTFHVALSKKRCISYFFLQLLDFFTWYACDYL